MKTAFQLPCNTILELAKTLTIQLEKKASEKPQPSFKKHTY